MTGSAHRRPTTSPELTLDTEHPARAAARHSAEDPRAEALHATQAALAAEHAAVYGYGVVGGRLDGDLARHAREAHAAHRARRDALHRAVRALGGTPEPAAVAYALPFEVAGRDEAVRLATELEERLAAVYADLVRSTGGSARLEAAASLREAAVRATRWRGGATPFPGLPEHAPGRTASGVGDGRDGPGTTDTEEDL
ncbi:hypothetical protein GCM10009716_06370 [Streptomyces sodiiphilus]|uniref:DUF4439 domain-containing protein n=1 Tax=Streptomyces sodiiphilus TaxID=226217 RepID=A0ABN2NRN6_9ACTN